MSNPTKNVLETGTLPTGTVAVDPNQEPSEEQMILATVALRESCHRCATEELNSKAADMLALGIITQAQHDAVVAENNRALARRLGRMYGWKA